MDLGPIKTGLNPPYTCFVSVQSQRYLLVDYCLRLVLFFSLISVVATVFFLLIFHRALSVGPFRASNWMLFPHDEGVVVTVGGFYFYF